jgi:phenylalanyl-tRNA synthetase beta chain
MRISPQWLREFVDLKVDARRLADDLTQAGIAVESISGEGVDTIFEMEIGTNRVDAMNHYGVAREAAAIYDLELKPIKPKLPSSKGSETFPVEIKDKQGCLRFSARMIRGVKIAPSPSWMIERLRIEEHGGVSNAVDASNYTLMEMGHPTHAYDMDKLAGGKLIVRRAKTGEKLTTLDGVERKLSAEDLVIADAEKPVGLAGVMGGLDSAISASTRNILIEAAWFDPVSVRKTARRHGMHTDASHRFERGADWGATALACDRVAELVLETAGGELYGKINDVVAGHVVRHAIWLRHNELLRILGQDIDKKTVTRILKRLGFTVSTLKESLPKGAKVVMSPKTLAELRAKYKSKGITLPNWNIDNENDVVVEPPTWRLDVESEIDLVEEVARLYGYNKFENHLPSFGGGVAELPDQRQRDKARATMLALGYAEAISLTFIAEADARRFAKTEPVRLENPVSEELSVLRTSMVPGMLDMLAHNLNRGTDDVRLFEAGSIFEYEGSGTREPRMLALGATGKTSMAGVHRSSHPFGFFDMKGELEVLFGTFAHQSLSFEAKAADYYHPGRSARVLMDGVAIAQFGQIHPEVAAARKIKADVYLAEVDLDKLFARGLREPHYTPVPRFPAVERDFSFLFPEEVPFERIRAAVDVLKLETLQSFAPVEIFRGGAVPAGKYSLLLCAVFRSGERTLRDDEVAGWSQQIIRALEALGGTLRA